MSSRIYLDNNATTCVDPLVVEAMKPYFDEEYGNASSIHSFGQKARAALEEARGQVALFLGAGSDEIVFTSGGTESDNLALCGVARRLRHKGNQIIISAIEHPAVLMAFDGMQAEGFRVTRLPVDHQGRVGLADVEDALSDETILISAMMANNETGTVQPIREIALLAHGKGVLVHTDAVQAAGKVPIDVEQLGVDLLSISGHKFHGPKGVGALYVRQGVRLQPIMLGGGHERGMRAGTENVSGAVGLGMACQVARQELSKAAERMSRLRDRLEEGILNSIPDTVVNGCRQSRTPQTSNISFLGAEGESLLMALDLQGIAVSTGAACHAGTVSASHVLTAMHLSRETLQGAIRFSLSRFTTEEEIERTLEVLPGVVERVRQVAGRY